LPLINTIIKLLRKLPLGFIVIGVKVFRVEDQFGKYSLSEYVNETNKLTEEQKLESIVICENHYGIIMYNFFMYTKNNFHIEFNLSLILEFNI